MALSIDLTGYHAVVTGVSSGIGAGIARALAQAGCDVWPITFPADRKEEQ